MNQSNSTPLFGLAPSLEGNNWMSRFDGSTSLAQLTIPGTHDSGALYNLDTSGASQPLFQFAVDTVLPFMNTVDSTLHSVASVFDNLSTIAYYTPFTGDLHYTLTDIQNGALGAANDVANLRAQLTPLLSADLAQAQTLSISEQLDSGVRFLDLRGRPVNDSLELYHGAIPQDQSFSEALGTVAGFLEANPSEAVVVYTQKENGNTIEGIDFSNRSWLSNLVFGEVSDESQPSDIDKAVRPITDRVGANLTAALTASPQKLSAGRSDYLSDLKQNFEGATANGLFKSNEATQNFYNLLRDNYGLDLVPLTRDTVLGDYSSLATGGMFIPIVGGYIADLNKILNSALFEVNSAVAKMALSWLELQQTADASMTFEGGNSTINGPYNTALSYDELLEQYVQELGADKFYLENEVPTLDEARGKIVLMVRDMDGDSQDGTPLGIQRPKDPDNTEGKAVENAAGETTLVYQDYYEPSSALAKWDAFTTLADAAFGDKGAPSNLIHEDALYVNYLSATSEEAYKTFDIERIGPVGYAFNAPVEIDGDTYQGLNGALVDVFLEERPDGRYGSMLIDFIDQDIARGIYEMNPVVGSSFMLNAALEPTVMRVDSAEDGRSSIQDVSFGLKRMGAESPDIILQSSGPAVMPASLDMLDSNWLARESVALGDVANASQDLPVGVYLPVAILADGTELAIQDVVAHDPAHLEVTFAAGKDGYVAPRAVFKLEGMDAVVVPADTDTAVNVQVARLGQFTNGLAFYEAEQGTGAITVDGQTLLPGDDGYLQGALNLAKSVGTVIRGDQMPEFGETASFADLDLEAGLTYGILLMHEDNEADLSSSFSDANRGGHSQIVELPSTDGSIWYGIEDLHVATGGSDRDFNDLLVNVQFA